MNKTVLVYDYGTYLSFAQRLVGFFDRVLYFNVWKQQAPKTRVREIGTGVQGVEKVYNFFDVIDEVDLFVFPDVLDGDLQLHLESLGKLVWGSRKGEELELDRWQTHLLKQRLGLSVTPTRRVIGTTALESLLKRTKDKYVKRSTVRGDGETFHHDIFTTSRDELRRLNHDLAAKSEQAEFLVEDPIPDAVEIGYDGWSIDGQFPTIGMQGYEVKDCGLIGVIKPYDELDPRLTAINSRLSDILAQYGYRGFWSTEVRVTTTDSFLIDPCCRLGSPPSELYQMLYNNWDEILWSGAQGNLVVPVTTARYGVQVILVSHWADRNWQSVVFPDAVAPFVKLKNFTEIDGVTHVMPQDNELVEIGSVVGVGETLQEAIEQVKTVADQVKAFGLKPKLDALRDAVKLIQDGEEKGIDFMYSDDKLPNMDKVLA